MPAKAGIQYSAALRFNRWRLRLLGPRLRGDDGSAYDPRGRSRCRPMSRSYYVYILASEIGGTLYVGVTNDLVRRVYEHRTKVVDGFTKKYDVARLVYYEAYNDIENAIAREKRL